ncbi:MAG: dCTP deaminase [Candidatus Pacebacteria bacterium]|nr:dCTP deaminase [Candidatus Paceibacterota bacterium]
MILCDKDIKKAIKDGDLIFREKLNSEQIEVASIDLKLGPIFKTFKHTSESVLDLKKGVDFSKIMDTEIVDKKKGFILHPNRFVLVSSKEFMKLSNRIAIRAEGKSSLARMGLLVHTAGFVDPGFEGTLTLEISNQAEIPIMLYPDMYICQIAVEWLSSPCELSYSQRRKSLYHKSEGPKVASAQNLFKKKGE